MGKVKSFTDSKIGDPDSAKCKWKNCTCEKANHKQNKKYPKRSKKGLVKKGLPRFHPSTISNYIPPHYAESDNLLDDAEAFLELQDKIFEKFVPNYTLLQQYRTEPTWNNKYAHSYPYQMHHVIPGNILREEKLPDLYKNLELLGWSMNGVNNAIPLPKWDIDLVWHDLQPHRGPHPNYDILVLGELSALQQESRDLCGETDHTEQLGNLMQQKIDSFRENILNWVWEIMPGARTLRTSYFKRYSKGKSTPALGDRKYPVKY